MPLRNQPYLPLYVQDFLTDEKLIECSAQATGVYIRLMCIMHKSEPYGTILLKQKDKQTDKQIKNFASKLAKHLPYDLNVIENSLDELIDGGVLILEGDKIFQKRMVKDNSISDKRADAGSKGGKVAQAKVKAKYKANSEYENENEIVIESKVDKSIVYSDDFLSFWKLYPRCVSKKKSFESWQRAKGKPPIEEILAKIELQKKSDQWQKDGGQYIPMSTTYINQARWDDEVGVNIQTIKRMVV